MAPSRDIISRRHRRTIPLGEKGNILSVMADRSTTDHRPITDRSSPLPWSMDGRPCMAALSPEQPDQGGAAVPKLNAESIRRKREKLEAELEALRAKERSAA